MRCWKSHCQERPPWLAVQPEWAGGSALLCCTDHLSQLVALGFDVHRLEDVLADPAARLGDNADLVYAALRHGERGRPA